MKELKYVHKKENGKGIWRLPTDNQTGKLQRKIQTTNKILSKSTYIKQS